MRAGSALLLLSMVLACRPAARPVEPTAPAPTPPAPSHVDRLLALVPAGAELMIARDASVVLGYIEESVRFFDGPLATLGRGPLADQEQLRAAQATFAKLTAVAAASATLADAGIRLEDGAVLARYPSGTSYIIFAADDPQALVKVGEATGARSMTRLRCRGIDRAPGFNVCADSQPELDRYVPSRDPRPFRADLGAHLPGVSLDDANLLAHIATPSETYMAADTTPGRATMAIATPGNPSLADLRKTVQPGPELLLSRVQPGAGFTWARMNPAAFNDPSDPSVASLTGEMLVAGSTDPAAVMLLLGIRDASAVEPLLDPLQGIIAEAVATELPVLPGVEWSIETTEIGRGGRRARAIHLAMNDSMLAQMLVRYTGLHPDAWIYAAEGAVVAAVGPDRDHGGELLAASTTSSADVLRSLPPELVASLERQEVGVIMHVPLDFLQSAPLRDLVVAALSVPDSVVPGEQLLAAASLWAPFSSITMWFTQHGDASVMHIAVQAIGTRATEEGRAALDAAHAVVEGGDPVELFGRLATLHAGSPMASAYAIRASPRGTELLPKSGVGALVAGAVVLLGVLQASAMASDFADDPTAREAERYRAYEH